MSKNTLTKYGYALLFGFALLVTGCERHEASPQAEDVTESVNEPAKPAAADEDTMVTVNVLSYMERESGVEPYPLRILVNAEYVRLDDGFNESDFVLLVRESGELYSVTHENKSVLLINHQALAGSLPDSIELSEEVTTDKDAPAIDGKQPLHIKYLANQTVCRESISVKGVMQAAVEGMQQFANTLGERQSNNMQSMPESMQTPCFLSRYVYATGRLFEHGLPIQIWDQSGFYRSLTDYSATEQVPASLFSVPEEYQGMTL